MIDLGRLFLAAAARSPEACAIVDGPRRLTYAEWAGRIGNAVAGLDALGLGPGDHLVTVLRNRLEAATLHWACQFTGVVVTPINWRSTGDELAWVLDDADARALVYEPASAMAVGEAAAVAAVAGTKAEKPEGRTFPRIALDGVPHATGSWEEVFQASDGQDPASVADPASPPGLAPRSVPASRPGPPARLDAGSGSALPSGPGPAPLAGLASASGGARASSPMSAGLAPRAAAEDVSVMLYTSGTTGRGKGVPRRHRAEQAAALAHVAHHQYAFGESTLGVMPLYHTMGVRSLLATAALSGCFVCQPRFDAAEALDLIETEGITSLYLVPTLYHDLLGHPAFSPERVASVRRVGFAGMPMTDALVRRVEEGFRPELFVNHYGSSEVFTFTVDQHAARKPGSAGRAGLNQEVRVVRLGSADPDDTVAAPGEEGQIAVRLDSGEAFDGYWRRPDADAKALHRGWYFTGDTGYRDADGDLFVTGRVDDMIISGGENVTPVEVENVLSLHPAVAEVAVAGLPDERWGQRVAAFVVRREPVGEDALDAHCRASTLPAFKRPRAYAFVREIPKSPVGKVLRHRLIAGEYGPEL